VCRVLDRQPFAPGGRRLRRPAAVHRCAECGELAGRGYPDCVDCAGLLDGLWLADWYALLTEQEVTPGGAAESQFAERVLAAELGAFPWTCLDWAMSVIGCPQCGSELGAGPVGCVLCRIADETRWAWQHEAPADRLTANERAVRTARVVLRAPHRHRATVVQTWRLSLPFLLVGATCEAVNGPWLRAYLRSGRYDELAAAASLRQLAGTPDLPWR
jgi:hypothetical protein